MEKPMYEILSNDIEMVEDMIDALMIAPKGYKLHPMGNKCALAVDHIHECVYADEEMWINDYEYEIVSEAKEMALPVETDVPDEKLATYADKELYVVIGYDDVCGNGNYEASVIIISAKQFSNEKDSNKIYAFSSIIIALISCIISTVTFVMQFLM